MALLDDMKDLQEALAVTNRIQNRHALMIEDHQRWLEAVQASVLEAHRLIDQISAVQLVTQEGLQKLEATVQAFIDSLRRGGNGRG